MKKFEMPWRVPKCDTETQSEQVLEKWCQRLAWHRVSTNLQLVKNAGSMKHNKLKHSKNEVCMYMQFLFIFLTMFGVVRLCTSLVAQMVPYCFNLCYLDSYWGWTYFYMCIGHLNSLISEMPVRFWPFSYCLVCLIDLQKFITYSGSLSYASYMLCKSSLWFVF